MAIMDHRNHDGVCIWDHDKWPCSTALIRHELAEYLRTERVEVEGWAFNQAAAEYNDGVLDGVRRAADAIDIEL